jgi:glycosyltransferase involved in cell wall biosynthesis
MKFDPTTNLTMKCDNRSGNRLEIVLPTLNEEKRIAKIIQYYSKFFDIVILDGGSIDNTCKITQENGGSVFERVGDNIGENHFAYYVNHCTKSGRCFYMMCDEFIDKDSLSIISSKLEFGKGKVFGRRFDWFYGIRARELNCLIPKGFMKGDAEYNPKNFHDTLSFKNKSNADNNVVDVEHLHVFSMKDDYGKFGNYIYQEVNQICKEKNVFLSSMLRAARLIRALQLNSLRYITSPRIVLFLIIQFFATLFIFILAAIEIKLLPSKELQLQKYNKCFDENQII